MFGYTLDMRPDIYAYVVFLVPLVVAGVYLNVIFVLRNRGFVKKKEKIADIKLLTSLLAIFNILNLFDAIVFSIFSILLVEDVRFDSTYCNLYEHFCTTIKFGIAYFLTAISKECYVMSTNREGSLMSNRFQMLVEALLVWSLHFVFLEGLIYLAGGPSDYTFCDEFNPKLFREPVYPIVVLMMMIFTALTRCAEKNTEERNPMNIHVFQQSRKMCLLYIIGWVPRFTFMMCRIFGSLSFMDYILITWQRILFRFLSWLGLFCVAVFPLVWKINYRTAEIEHELL